MKIIKKLICALLCFGLLSCTDIVFAAKPINTDNASAINFEKPKQKEIDDIFAQLNDLAAERRMIELFESNNSTNATKETPYINNTIATITKQEEQLDDRLEGLGVHKIDPNNKEDIERLEDVVLSAWKNEIAKMDTTSSIPAPPDFYSIADCYSLYQHTGVTTVNGVSYNYSYIRVIDDKGYSRSPLTSSKEIHMVTQINTVLSDLLSYNFSFGFSAFLGTTPYGWAADWTIGNVTTVFNSLAKDSPVTYSGNSDIYQMSLLSVTQMQYCYVYIPSGGWILCGANAPSISFARAESIVANVNGVAKADGKIYQTTTSSTGISAVGYVSNYVQTGSFRYDPIGSFEVKGELGETGKKTSTPFSPGFCSYPGHLG